VKYEVRMTLRFRLGKDQNKLCKSTVIEYLDANDLAEAYINAGEYKHELLVKIAKKMNDANEVSISVDAVVAMPELLDTKKLTYGDLGQIIMKNNKGQITVCLWILPDGTLADDSWIHHRGWGSKK